MTLASMTPEVMRECEQRVPRLFDLPPREKLIRWGAVVGGVLFLIFTFWKLEFSFVRILRGLDKLGWIFGFLFPPSHGGWLNEFLVALGETLAMAFVGNLVAFVLAIPLGFLAAQNVIHNPLIHFTLRRSFDIVRGVNILIWALMLVHVTGMGPFAGIMAIIITETATLSKLYSEAIENVDTKQIEGAESTGANRVQIIRYAFLPQIVPVMISTLLYFFESTVRSATILGVMGAGGIGMQLTERIRIMNWNEVCFIIIMILITVAVIDTLSKIVREKIVANPEYRP